MPTDKAFSARLNNVALAYKRLSDLFISGHPILPYVFILKTHGQNAHLSLVAFVATVFITGIDAVAVTTSLASSSSSNYSYTAIASSAAYSVNGTLTASTSFPTYTANASSSTYLSNHTFIPSSSVGSSYFLNFTATASFTTAYRSFSCTIGIGLPKQLDIAFVRIPVGAPVIGHACSAIFLHQLSKQLAFPSSDYPSGSVFPSSAHPSGALSSAYACGQYSLHQPIKHSYSLRQCTIGASVICLPSSFYSLPRRSHPEPLRQTPRAAPTFSQPSQQHNPLLLPLFKARKFLYHLRRQVQYFGWAYTISSSSHISFVIVILQVDLDE
ncbi:hypothetical protein BDZ97DRAFT_1914407 [Flammula alnicola]|nr:hypothetical protein BDZ97DRAFT_1914407 [Flammula alnicola]